MMLLETMIKTGRFSKFVDTLYEKYNEDKMWEYYLHTSARYVSFEEFKRKVEAPEETIEKEEMTEIVRDSLDILAKQ